MINLEAETRDRFKTSPEYKDLKQEQDLFKRRIQFIAFLSEKLKEEGVDAILVGGEAIDLYTAGNFATSDIDLLVTNRPVTEKMLNKFGFGKEANRVWFNKDLNIVIQVIPEPYSGDPVRLRKFRIKDFELRVAAPEDLIANRLYSKSNPQRDSEQAIALLKIFAVSIDNTYLNKVAKRDNIEEVLAEAIEYASKI